MQLGVAVHVASAEGDNDALEEAPVPVCRNVLAAARQQQLQQVAAANHLMPLGVSTLDELERYLDEAGERQVVVQHHSVEAALGQLADLRVRVQRETHEVGEEAQLQSAAVALVVEHTLHEETANRLGLQVAGNVVWTEHGVAVLVELELSLRLGVTALAEGRAVHEEGGDRVNE
jgi:hypothetical protein